MEVTYTLNRNDLKSFQIYHYYVRPFRTAPVRFVLMIAGIILAFAIGLYYQITFVDVATSVRLFVGGMFAIAVGGVILFFTPKRKFRSVTVVISSQGLICSDETGRNHAYWKAFSSVEKTRKHIYVYLSTGPAYVVPRRAFPDQESFDRFAESARESIELAKTTPADQAPSGDVAVFPATSPIPRLPRVDP